LKGNPEREAPFLSWEGEGRKGGGGRPEGKGALAQDGCSKKKGEHISRRKSWGRKRRKPGGSRGKNEFMIHQGKRKQKKGKRV